MHEPHQHAFAGAVGAEDDGARPGFDLQRHRLDDVEERNGLQLQRQDQPYLRCAASLSRNAPALSSSTMPISTTPRPRASGRSPLEVSRAIVVVMTRVTPSMLPPTIITAPTSALARPKPASTAVRSEKRTSHSTVSAALAPSTPSERNCSSYSSHASSTA